MSAITFIDKFAMYKKNSVKDKKWNMRFCAYILLDNQLHKHTIMSTVFGSSDERVFLILLPSEISNRSHGTEVTGMR